MDRAFWFLGLTECCQCQESHRYSHFRFNILKCLWLKKKPNKKTSTKKVVWYLRECDSWNVPSTSSVEWLAGFRDACAQATLPICSSCFLRSPEQTEKQNSKTSVLPSEKRNSVNCNTLLGCKNLSWQEKKPDCNQPSASGMLKGSQPPWF